MDHEHRALAILGSRIEGVDDRSLIVNHSYRIVYQCGTPKLRKQQFRQAER